MIANSRQYFWITGLLVCVAFAVSLHVGRYPLGFGEMFAAFFGGQVDETAKSVFLTLRLPRTVMAMLAGLGLGLSGAVFQLVFKNPLASPEIIGVSSGANLGAALAIVVFGHYAVVTATSAFFGGMLALLLVVALAALSRNNSTVTYILAGIIAKAVADAFIMMLKFFADPERELAAMEYWAMGSLANITAAKLLAVLPFFLIGISGLVLLRRQITMLGLEDDESRALGVRVRLIRITVLGFAALTVAAIICQTGLIVFAGLIAPHAARLALKRVSFAWCALSALMGAFILLVSDCVARGIASVEIPISIPTTLIGVPVLLYFMWSRKAGRV